MSKLFDYARLAAVVLLSTLAWPATPAQAAAPPMTQDQIIANAASGMGYSYWWGHGRWDPSGVKYAGQCRKTSSSGCPNCVHSATGGGPEYGADCSGFVAKVWQVPSTISMTHDDHPYVASDFRVSASNWKWVAKKYWQRGDALSNGHHVVIFERWSSGGKATVYECSGCSKGCIHRSISVSGFSGTRRNNVSDTPANQPPKGKLESVDCQVAKGWAQDPNAAKESISVQLSFDGPLGSTSATVVKALANSDRPDLTSALGSANHGFRVTVPARYLDGRSHSVYAYGLDKEGKIAPTKLLGSPQTFKCTMTCTQIADQRHWQGIGCETGGNNACQGQGVKTSDCDHCCGSTCTQDTDCSSSGNVCAWSGRNYCCRAPGATGTSCFHDTECTAGNVCAWNGQKFVCTRGSCLDY